MRPLLKFFSLTFAVTWTCFIAAIALAGRFGSMDLAGPDFRTPLLYLGTFAPAFVAVGIIAWDEGRSGIDALLRRFTWPSATRWYMFAIGYMAAIKLTVAVVYRLGTGAWPRFGSDPWYIIAVVIVTSTPVQAGEEIGWRGYALPRLAARLGLARASLLLGLIHACWHLPLFYLPGHGSYGQSFPMYVLGVIGASVAASWLYANTNGSLLMTMLLHSAWNQTVGIVPSADPVATNPFALSASLVGWLTVAILWIPTAYFLVRMRHIELSASEPTTATAVRT